MGDDLGAPEQVLAAVTHCMIHPEGEGTCGDGIDRAPLSRDYDLAVLVLADRFDTSPTSLYPVTHARIVEEDPSGPLGHEAQEWLGTPVRFAGYGQLGWEDSRISRVRLHAESRISAVYPRTFWAHDFGTIPGSVAFFGDSGGGVFAGNAESDTPFIDDGRPLQILGVHYASDPSSNYAVLLTASATQNFIEGFLGPVAEHYAGAMVEVSPTQSVWTGAPDVPRAGAPERTAAHDAADPDGDGFVGLHDNCWGHFNPRQAVSDEGFAGTCFTVPLRERRTYGCAARRARRGRGAGARHGSREPR